MSDTRRPGGRRRVLVGGVWHETNSFSPLRTDLPAFRRYQYLEGAQVLAESAGTNTEIGGMIGAAAGLGLELVPTLYAGAAPSGMVERAALDHIVNRIVEGAGRHWPLAGVLLALHGAMVAEGIDEADAYLLARVREAVGPDCPIVATFDLHANLSSAFVEGADVLVGYNTLPHVDMAERGGEAAAIIARLIDEDWRPARAFRKLPLLSPPQTQATHESPMREIMAVREDIARDPAILSASVVAGFPYCDVPQLGMAVLVYGQLEAVDHAADRLAGAVWSHRAGFIPALISPAEAVRRAVSATEGPVFLVEPADNIGGGAPGDGTHILKALLDHGASDAVTVLWDPEAARAAAEAGAGGWFESPVGGRALDLQGTPVQLAGRIAFCGPVRYQRDSSWMTGQTADLGLVATIESGGVRVIVTSERAIPFDTLHLRIPGVVPEEAKIITLKCGSAWSQAFGDMAAGHFYVDTAGICSSNIERMPYSRFTRRVYPMHADTVWPARS